MTSEAEFWDDNFDHAAYLAANHVDTHVCSDLCTADWQDPATTLDPAAERRRPNQLAAVLRNGTTITLPVETWLYQDKIYAIFTAMGFVDELPPPMDEDDWLDSIFAILETAETETTP